jgi:hypothetical protein
MTLFRRRLALRIGPNVQQRFADLNQTCPKVQLSKLLSPFHYGTQLETSSTDPFIGVMQTNRVPGFTRRVR